ncbi:MAG: M16 family metallopeptidase [bacterium]
MKFNVIEHRLNNGLLVLCMEDHTSPAISYQVHYAVGTRNEKPGIIGISHLFEHLMFRGSKELGPEEISRIIQSNGGSINAFTSKDNTSFFENLPSDKLELAIRLEAERLEHLALDQENLDMEREVVRDERKLRIVNSPYGLVDEQLYLTAFDQHPYQWPIIGFDSNLVGMTLDDCRKFYRTYYAPNNSVVVIVGDIQPDKAIGLVEKYYGHLARQEPPEPLRSIERSQRGEKRVLFKKVSRVEAMFAGFHIPGIKDEETIALIALSTILSSGKSSRFYGKFIQPGRVIEVGTSAGFPPFISMDPGLFELIAIAPLKTDIASLEMEIYAEIDKIKEDGPSEDEVSKAKKQLKSATIRLIQTQFNKGLIIGIGQIRSGDCNYLHYFLEKLASLSCEKIKEVAAAYLTADNRTVVRLMPVPEEESAQLGQLL